MKRVRRTPLNTERKLYRSDTKLISAKGTIPIFIHVPKTAGRFFNKCFARAGVKIGKSIHTPARFIKSKVNNYNDRFSFAIVRNPYSRFLSACLFNYIPISEIETVSTKLVNGDINVVSEYSIYHYEHFFTQKHFVTDFDNETVIVDYIGKYETLMQAVIDLKEKGVDISNVFELKENKSSKWKDVLTDKTIENINKMYKEDFEQFNYKMI